MLGKICAARDQLAIVPFAVYPVLAVIWMAIRRGTLREVQDTGRVPWWLTGAFYAGNFREWSQSSLVIIIPATPSNPSIPYVKRTSKMKIWGTSGNNWYFLFLSQLQMNIHRWYCHLIAISWVFQDAKVKAANDLVRGKVGHVALGPAAFALKITQVCLLGRWPGI